MDGPTLVKRKRIVTACIECHRRKQKCDHSRPCSNCVARNVREKCIYDDREDMRGQDRSFQASEQPEHSPSHFTSQAGYSRSSDNNTYAAVQKALLIYPRTQHNITAPPRDVGIKDKYRQVLGQLPSMQVTKELVENYFVEANWYFLVLERFYFNQLHKSWLDSREKGINHVPLHLQHFTPLLFQVLAVALQFLPLDSSCAKALSLVDLTDADQLSYKYSTAGTELMQALGRHHSTIVSVQHDVIRSLWLKNCSRGTESWYSLGDAIKQAQDLELHLQCDIRQSESIELEKTLADLWYDEYKRRLWITLFIWDSHMAFVLGRPRAINMFDCTVRTPLDCNIPEQPSKIIPTPANTSDVPSTYSAHLFHYFLAQKIHGILSKGANKPFFTDYTFIQNLHEQVMSQLHNLPPAVRPENPDTSWDSQYPRLLKQRQHISNAAQSFLVALHRPHVNTHAESRKSGTEAAFACLRAQQRLFDLVGEHQYKIYNLSFYTIDAGMFLAAMVIEQTSTERSLLVETYMVLCQAIARLNLMQNRSAMAKSGLQLLTHCCQRICLLHGIDHNAFTSLSPYQAGVSQKDIDTPDPAQFIDPALSNNPLQASRLGLTNPPRAHNPCNYASPPIDFSNASFGTGTATFGPPFNPMFASNSYLDDLSDLNPTEPISDSIWRDLLG